MSHIKAIILFICIFFSKIVSEEIYVQLNTEKSFIPLCLEEIQDKESNFDRIYLQSLREVLLFDLNHNGMTTVTQNCHDEKKLKSKGIYHVIKLNARKDQLSVCVLGLRGKTFYEMDNILLSGELSQDRRVIHQIADKIHHLLFGTDGIAITKILYALRKHMGDKWVSEIWETDYDGANARQVTFENNYCITPTYLPPQSGKKAGSFFYVSYKTSQPKIYVASLSDGLGKHVTSLYGNQLMPAVSRQRNMLAFISDVTTSPDLFILPFNPESGPTDKPRQIFSFHGATEGTPAFSPDGKQIAFVSNKDGSPRIYVMDIPEAGVSIKQLKPQLLTKRNRESTAPTWSPDGKKIAYCSRTQGQREIWVYDFDSQEERQITSGPGNKENPSWAPNSLHLVFNASTRNGEDELYLINLNQSNATKISSGPGEKRFPAWEP